MPFGLTNTPVTFQGLMNDVFRPFLRKFILIFFDDIIVYSITKEEHLHHLHLTLDTLKKHNLFAKRSKCCFGQDRVGYLGHLISKQGVEADPAKISCMLQWPLPSTLKGLRGFLGLIGCCRKFSRNYGAIAGSLTTMLKKNSF